MPKRLLPILCLAAGLLLAGCGGLDATPSPSIAPTLPIARLTPAQDTRQSDGGGEPRTAGYWLIWNTCMPDNQAETARANGGRQAGWIILDDLLEVPGILVGNLELKTCQQGANLLQWRDLAGADHSDDPAYTLASQLVTAQLNLAAGAATCPLAEKSVQAAQLLLLSLGFDGTQSYLESQVATRELDTALLLTDQLTDYNLGGLCTP